jgi:AcrR family transcriptional regulator
VHFSPARRRVIDAALDLFGEHGVSGTSLQMIADAIGVTKAAVYHQFPTKDEIILAVAQSELARLERALERAEAEESRLRAREVLLDEVIGLAVEHRHIAGTLQGDPVMARLLAGHEPFIRLMDRLYGLLLDDDAGPEGWVSAAMISAAIGGAVAHPLMANVDEATVRSHLTRLARRLLDLPE